MTIEPDTKDWTWVLARPCHECGFVAGDLAVGDLPAAFRDNAASWETALTGPDVAVRSQPGVWSVLEYACHVRDVHRVFEERVEMMLTEDAPRFANWDQDEAALAERYDEQDPAVVGPELVAAAAAVADRYAAVPADAWGRAGLRSNGSEFTIESLGRYHLHDVVHHLHDVARVARAATVAAYDSSAAAYREGGFGTSDLATALVERFAARVPAGGRVLEIGSGPGRDARKLEDAGLSVRRTDVSPGFAELLRADGHRVDVLDPLTDDLADPERPATPYDAVWASACLLHVGRPDLPVVLRRLADATRPGGTLHASFKEGDGEAWATHGQVTAPRHFTYWREGPLLAVLEDAGWSVDEVGRHEGLRGDSWLGVLATRGTG
jgi:SAM-dependent methyltransferase